MSGIILPGKDNEPEQTSSGDSGIELPKGFSRAKEEKATERAATAEGASGGPAAAGPEADFLFPPQVAQIQCPNCGTPYPVAVFSIVDFGENPELRGALLGNQINMAICPNCGAGGALSAPLMVHDPEHEFLGVYLPADGQLNENQRQKAIGDLTQRLMRKLPSEARRGYMLQPKQFIDWQRFMEVFWGYEGVTPEMLRRQREQTELLQRLLGLAGDPKALELAIEREKGLIDREFLTLLDRIFVMSRGQADEETMNAFMGLRNQLLESTEAGAEVKQREDRLRSLLAQIDQGSTREDVLDLLLSVWRNEEDRDLLGSLGVALTPLLDYQFLLAVAERLAESEDETEREHLEELRELVMQIQDAQRQSQQSSGQQAQAVLQEVLQSADPKAELANYADYIDEDFLRLLAGNIQAAEQNNATAAVRRLRQIYEAAIEILEEGMPEDIRFLNELLSIEDETTQRRLIKENRQLLTPELIQSLAAFENQARSGGQAELADRIKSLRAQIALMG
jgi:hypothetical protein